MLSLTSCVSLVLAVLSSTHFVEKTLSVEGDIRTVSAVDLDGDGKQDLVASFRPKEGTTHSLAVFWNRGAQFFEKPDLVLRTDANQAGYDVSPGAIFFLGQRGVERVAFNQRIAGAVARISNTPTALFQQDQDDFPRTKIVHGDLLLVPRLGFVDVLKIDGSAVQSIAVSGVSRVRLAGPRSRLPNQSSHFSTDYVFPNLKLIDANNDGKSDLVVVLEDRVVVHHRLDGLLFANEPTLSRDFATRSSSERADSNVRIESDAIDLNGDGFVDLVVRKQVSQGITSGKSLTYVYLGSREGFSSKPLQQLETEGIGGSEAIVLDVTNDGRPDLLIPSVKIGVWAVIRILTSKTLKVAFHLHPFDPQTGAFTPEPTGEKELSFSVSLSGRRDLQVLDIRGDYNGDKRRDLLFGAGDNKLQLFLGTDGGAVVSEEAEETIKVFARGESQAVDLEGSGRDDVIITYPTTPGRRQQVVVLHNQKPW